MKETSMQTTTPRLAAAAIATAIGASLGPGPRLAQDKPNIDEIKATTSGWVEYYKCGPNYYRAVF